MAHCRAMASVDTLLSSPTMTCRAFDESVLQPPESVDWDTSSSYLRNMDSEE
jgi:hypothetical protein